MTIDAHRHGQRYDSAADWASVNPVLGAGEFGVESDTLKVKIGDGATQWTGLPYALDLVGVATEGYVDDAIADLSATYATKALFARKTANESVTSSTTLQNDDDLLAALAANKVYVFEAVLLVSGDSAGDIRIAFTVPAGATLRWAAVGAPYTAATSPSQAEAVNAGVVSASGTLENYGAFTGLELIFIRGIVVVAGTAGNLQLQWAQNASSGTATVVNAQSHLVTREVA